MALYGPDFPVEYIVVVHSAKRSHDRYVLVTVVEFCQNLIWPTSPSPSCNQALRATPGHGC